MERAKGFTLIELMIVVAILGIVSAVAIPAYQNYITRSQVSEAIVLGMGLKQQLNEFGWTHGQWPSSIVSPIVQASAQQINGSLEGKYSRLNNTLGGIYPIGTITLMMIDGRATGQTILFTTTDGGATWACNTGTLEARYRPAACR